MLLPSSFTSIIADTFYDKDVSILTKTTANSDGWVTETGTTVTSTFKANVQFLSLDDVQSELGLTDRIDVAITCATDVPIADDDLFSYDGITYKVASIAPRDSHLKIAGRKWA